MNQASESQRYVVDFSVDGDIKYISHQDSIRMFARAFARARIPVRFSQGFNPHPRFSMPLPRPVGVASQAERLVLPLTRTVAADELKQRLNEQMPHGIRVRDVRTLDPAEPCLPARVKYRVVPPALDPEQVQAAADRLMQSGPALVERYTGERSPRRTVDVRPFIDGIAVRDDAVDIMLLVTPKGTAKPAEVCGLLGLGSDTVNHLIRRMEVEWH